MSWSYPTRSRSRWQPPYAASCNENPWRDIRHRGPRVAGMGGRLGNGAVHIRCVSSTSSPMLARCWRVKLPPKPEVCWAFITAGFTRGEVVPCLIDASCSRTGRVDQPKMESTAGRVTQAHAHPPIPPDRPRLTGPRLGPGGFEWQWGIQACSCRPRSCLFADTTLGRVFASWST